MASKTLSRDLNCVSNSPRMPSCSHCRLHFRLGSEDTSTGIKPNAKASVGNGISKQPTQFEHIFRVASARIWGGEHGARVVN